MPRMYKAPRPDANKAVSGPKEKGEKASGNKPPMPPTVPIPPVAPDKATPEKEKKNESEGQ